MQMMASAFNAKNVCDTCWTAGLQMSTTVLGLLELRGMSAWVPSGQNITSGWAVWMQTTKTNVFKSQNSVEHFLFTNLHTQRWEA